MKILFEIDTRTIDTIRSLKENNIKTQGNALCKEPHKINSLKGNNSNMTNDSSHTERYLTLAGLSQLVEKNQYSKNNRMDIS